MTAKLNWSEPLDGPTWLSELFGYGEAMYQQGRAVERGDRALAERAHQAGIAALGAVLRMTHPPTSPRRRRWRAAAPR